MSQTIRVLHVVTQMNRNGLESRIMDIYRNIDRNKIQFDFLVHRKEEGEFDKEIENLGGIIYRIPPIQPTHFLRYLHTLDCFFKDHRQYKIVHAHLNSYCTWVLAAAKRNGVPIRIAHSRNSGMDLNTKAIFKYMSRLFINIPTTHKFACSHQAGEWLFGEKGILPPNFFRVIPNGFNLKKFTFDSAMREKMRQELGLREEKAYVLVGRLTLQKNHRFFLDIFEEIRKKESDSQCYFFGGGPLKESLEQTVKEKGMEDAVHFMGNRPNIGEYLQAMDMMIFPSVYEGFGTVVLETQCIGVPTLASDVLPRETKVTEIMDFMSVKNDSATKWAERAMQMADIPRVGHNEEVAAAGYDIEQSYRLLESFYLNVSELKG